MCNEVDPRFSRRAMLGTTAAAGLTLPAMGMTMVGTVEPTEKKTKKAKEDEPEPSPVFMTQHSFAAQLEANPEMEVDYRDGAEIVLESKDFTRASIDPLELRAVPTEEALKSMRKAR